MKNERHKPFADFWHANGICLSKDAYHLHAKTQQMVYVALVNHNLPKNYFDFFRSKILTSFSQWKTSNWLGVMRIHSRWLEVSWLLRMQYTDNMIIIYWYIINMIIYHDNYHVSSPISCPLLSFFISQPNLTSLGLG